MLNPKVQVRGNTAVLTFNLIDHIRSPKASLKEACWNATEIYCHMNGNWRIIHTHWSPTNVSS